MKKMRMFLVIVGLLNIASANISYGMKKHDLKEKKETCAICFEELGQNEIRILPCIHKFHKNCVDGWVKDKNTCPMCRKKVRQGDDTVVHNTSETIERETRTGNFDFDGIISHCRANPRARVARFDRLENVTIDDSTEMSTSRNGNSLSMINGQVIINGRVVANNASSVSMINGQIIVDGQVVDGSQSISMEPEQEETVENEQFFKKSIVRKRMKNCTLKKCTIERSNLESCYLIDCKIVRSNVRGGSVVVNGNEIERSMFEECSTIKLVNCLVSWCKIKNGCGRNIKKRVLKGCTIERVDPIEKCSIENCSFSWSKVKDSLLSIKDRKLERTTFENCEKLKITGSSVAWCNIKNDNTDGIENRVLSGCEIERTPIKKCELIDCTLSWSKLKGCKQERCLFDRWTSVE